MHSPSCESQPSQTIERARTEVLAWLRSEDRNPRFLVDEPEAELSKRHKEIVERFISWVEPAGFAAQILPAHYAGEAALEVQWTFKGASFVGFKQGPPADNPEDAMLFGCAALLHNDWCRSRLP